MSKNVKDIDIGFKKLIKELSNLGNLRIKVGVQGDEAREAKTFTDSQGNERKAKVDLVTVASANEFGTDDIPERSFLRSTMIKNERLNYQRLSEVKKLVAENKFDAEDLLKKVGLAVVADVQKTITEGGVPYVPNAEATIESKGSSSPLIDTGQLRQSITFALEKVKK